ncbi:FlgD immunoglobulin-like domain containing protein [Candidatus Latescibacterota bacterium]
MEFLYRQVKYVKNRAHIFSALVLLLLLASTSDAQDLSVYGSPLEITISVDINALYQNYHDSESKEDYRLWQQWSSLGLGHGTQAWSPDGKWIAFNGALRDFLWIVSTDGGIPTCIFSDTSYETEKHIFFSSIGDLSFTPDSQEITFYNTHIDVEKGSIADIDETGGGTIGPGQYSIESINIYTGVHRVIVEGTKPCWSSDGRYLCYLNFDYREYIDELEADHSNALTILDTVTGEKWFLTDGSPHVYSPSIHSCHFTPDDSSVIFSMDIEDNQSQFFRVPINGGEPEQISFPIHDGDGTGYQRRDFDISFDGKWIIYTDINENKLFEYSGSTGGRAYSTSRQTYHLCAFNIASGETYKLFPEPQDTNMYGQTPSFSADGTKFCYGLSDWNSRDTKSPHIYISDFDPDSFRKIVHVEEEHPGGYVLMENYPNPFNPTTTIEFTLPEAGFTELSVYNISGQKVRDLVSEEMTAGVHSAVWDGRDQQGNPVSSGVFISRLRTRDNVFSNRMILVK